LGITRMAGQREKIGHCRFQHFRFSIAAWRRDAYLGARQGTWRCLLEQPKINWGRMETERESWNRRYGEGGHGSSTPDPLLLRAYENYIAPLFARPGMALDVAGGIGRHAIWLARHGWRVTLMDISEVGIAQARKNARGLSKQLDFVIRDLTKFKAGGKRYDLILVFFYLQRSIFSELIKALGPGGLLIYKTYTLEQRKFEGGPRHPLHLLKPNEFLRAFSDLRVLYYTETIHTRGVAELVGRKKR
jgi:tellurite methyltransferase